MLLAIQIYIHFGDLDLDGWCKAPLWGIQTQAISTCKHAFTHRTIGGYVEDDEEWLEEASRLAEIIKANNGETVSLSHMYW